MSRHHNERYSDDHNENRGHQGSNDHGDGNFQVFATTFTALNNSGVTASAVLVLDQAHHDLIVKIDATGLTPDQVHPQHIHGFLDNTDSMSPTIAQDSDHDGFVELAEGQATYGPILLNLTNNPQDSVHDHGTGHDHTGNAMFPTADANGDLHYLQTFHFDPADPNATAIFDSIKALDLKELVLHGENVAAGSGAGTTGEVDGTAGYKLVLPVASGELHEVTGGQSHKLVAELRHDIHHDGTDFMTGHHA